MSGLPLSLHAELEQSAAEVARIMRLLSNERRLMILCKLAEGEKSVTCLMTELGIRQSNVSQQLALLRQEGLVCGRREAQTIYYSLTDGKVRRIMELLYELYCAPED
ncbi:MAG: ArsR/SmtB family transcription factor [Alphaproteobacteria bacterium]